MAKRDEDFIPVDVPSRIDELRGLEAGWLDGYGKAPSQEGLNWFSNAFENRYPDDLALPYIYPTEWQKETETLFLPIVWKEQNS
jgi:hypothetical protein